MIYVFLGVILFYCLLFWYAERCNRSVRKTMLKDRVRS